MQMQQWGDMLEGSAFRLQSVALPLHLTQGSAFTGSANHSLRFGPYAAIKDGQNGIRGWLPI